MDNFGSCYWVCVTYTGVPLGYVGVIDNDIRFCVEPACQGLGIGTYMLRFVKDKFPDASGKVKVNNTASKKAFEKAGVPWEFLK